MNFDNYIFDFDGTLADTTSCHVYATEQAFKELNLKNPGKEEILSAQSQPLEEGLRSLTSIGIDEEKVELFIRAYHKYYSQYEIHNIKEFAGISEMLQLLHNKKKNIFVISSNETAVVTRQLDYLGLNRFIKDALGLHIKELRKPHYKILQSIIQNNHLNQGRTVYIGDTTHDVKSASLSDIRSCVVTWGAQSAHDLLQENPYYVVNEPEEIFTII